MGAVGMELGDAVSELVAFVSALGDAVTEPVTVDAVMVSVALLVSLPVSGAQAALPGSSLVPSARRPSAWTVPGSRPAGACFQPARSTRSRSRWGFLLRESGAVAATAGAVMTYGV
jgi:hypothetical protein